MPVRFARRCQRIRANPAGQRRDLVWHCYLPDVRPGQLYGYRVAGPVRTREGTSIQPQQGRARSLCKGIGRDVRWCDEMWGYKIGDPQADLSFDDRDNAHAAPLAVVIDPAFTWGDDRPPKHPWHETIIYEIHVKGFTKLHPGVPEELRGNLCRPDVARGDGSLRSWASPRSNCCRFINAATIAI